MFHVEAGARAGFEVDDETTEGVGVAGEFVHWITGVDATEEG